MTTDPRSARALALDELYLRNSDPWQMRTSAYEREKYAATLAALPRASYENGLEIGCSIGVLSGLLAGRCRRLTALDASATALDLARTHSDAANIDWLLGEIPEQWPEGRFDLIVLSEVLYFLEPDEVRAVAERAAANLRAGGTIIAVNWLGESQRTLDGETAAELLRHALEDAGIEGETVNRTEFYRIDVHADSRPTSSSE